MKKKVPAKNNSLRIPKGTPNAKAGTFVSKADRAEIEKLSNDTGQPIGKALQNFFADLYRVETEEKVPLFTLISEAETYNSNKKNFSVTIKGFGSSHPIKFSSFESAKFFMNAQISGIWRMIDKEKKSRKSAGKDSGTDVPIINFQSTYRKGDLTPQSVSIDFNKIASAYIDNNEDFDYDEDNEDLFY